MATLAPPSPSLSPTRMPRRWARKCERYCCIGATYFPLVFVYSITSWAVWVEATIGFLPAHTPWIGMSSDSASWALLIVCRQRILFSWNRTLHPPELVLYDSCLYKSRHYNGSQRIQFTAYTGATRGYELHRQIEWRAAILQEMPGAEAGSRAPLLNVPDVRIEDGSSLPLAGYLCGTAKLQSLPPLSYIYNVVLLRLLRGLGDLGLQGDIK